MFPCFWTGVPSADPSSLKSGLNHFEAGPKQWPLGALESAGLSTFICLWRHITLWMMGCNPGDFNGIFKWGQVVHWNNWGELTHKNDERGMNHQVGNGWWDITIFLLSTDLLAWSRWRPLFGGIPLLGIVLSHYNSNLLPLFNGNVKGDFLARVDVLNLNSGFLLPWLKVMATHHSCTIQTAIDHNFLGWHPDPIPAFTNVGLTFCVTNWV